MSTPTKIRVMIVEDSLVVRECLVDIVNRDPRLEVVAAVASAEIGLELLPDLKPDVISMDIRLPGMDGLQATKQIMSQRPTPIVVVSASVEKEDLMISVNALKAGALSIVEKPTGPTHADYGRIANQICTQLAIMSQVKVVRQNGRLERAPAPRPNREPSLTSDRFQMLGLVASTGGPAALERILSELPANLPVPVLLVQHMTPSFLEGFANWLQEVSSFPVHFATDGLIPRPACVYLAPNDCHLCLGSGRLWLDKRAPVSNQRPSGTVLLESMAHDLGPTAIGVLLTGMGNDGADGLLAIRTAGGYALTQDESTSTVYGMPRAAVRLGASHESLPIQEIAPRLLELLVGNKVAGGRHELQ